MELRLDLSEERRHALEREAERAGIEVETLIKRWVDDGLRHEVPTAPRAWMPRERWDALCRGEGCPLCALLQEKRRRRCLGLYRYEPTTEPLATRTEPKRPGYAVLLCIKHVREPHELLREERTALFEEVVEAAKAIEKVMGAVKMNLEILGNSVPHLHCHIKPRYYGDRAPGAPIHPDQHPLELAPAEYRERVLRIRSALAKFRPGAA